MAGVHRLDHVQGLGAAALADDDPVGPHPQGVRTRSRIVYSPAPSMFGGLVSSVTTCSWCSRSSVVSSIVTIRSLNGMKLLSTFSIVVLPVPVPPLTRMLRRSITHARRNVAAAVGDAAQVDQVVHRQPLGGELADRQAGPLTASGGMMALTREPSGSRASTSGWLLSIRRPTWATIRSMIDSVTLSEMNRRPDSLDQPAVLDVDLVAGRPP